VCEGVGGRREGRLGDKREGESEECGGGGEGRGRMQRKQKAADYNGGEKKDKGRKQKEKSMKKREGCVGRAGGRTGGRVRGRQPGLSGGLCKFVRFLAERVLNGFQKRELVLSSAPRPPPPPPQQPPPPDTNTLSRVHIFSKRALSSYYKDVKKCHTLKKTYSQNVI
jgi:hypothetical protein